MLALGPAHKRRLEVVLTGLDVALEEVIHLAKGQGTESALHIMVNDIPPSELSSLLSEIESVRTILFRLQKEFGLERRVQAASAVIWRVLTSAGMELHEVQPKRLADYGSLDEDSVKEIEHSIQYMQERLSRITGLVAASRLGA